MSPRRDVYAEIALRPPATPDTLPVEPDNIPTELTKLPRWLVWRWEQRDGRWTKPPYRPGGRSHAKSTDPTTWTDFPTVLSAYQADGWHGIGLALATDDDLAGIDLDHCRDPQTGEIEPWAADEVRAFSSYTEVSPSGKGLRIIFRGKLPGKGRKKGYVEVYDTSRYLTITGHWLRGTPRTIESRQAELDAFLARYFPPKERNTSTTTSSGLLSDGEVLTLAREASNGAKFDALYGGSHEGYPSASEADQAFCCQLAFYTRDGAQIDRLFRGSRRMRDKWDRADYRDTTIQSALQVVGEEYHPSQKGSENGQRSKVVPNVAEADEEPPPGKMELASPGVPMAVARQFLGARFTHTNGFPLLYHWRGGWWQWMGARYAEVEQGVLEKAAYHFTEDAWYWAKSGAHEEVRTAWAPTRRKIGDLLHALSALCFLPETIDQPTWLPGGGEHPRGLIVAHNNGLLEVAGRKLHRHDPRYFNATAVPFDYDPEVGDPTEWEDFLDALWGDDQESKDALCEFMGYVLSGRRDFDAILLIVGPTRGGKGTIARVLEALVGPVNTCWPTAATLAERFGLEPLLGKSLAVLSDARITGRNAEAAVENLLRISGRDGVTIDRKNRSQWNGQLPIRFMILSNELPRLSDTSQAIVGRLVVLALERSWLHHEDRELESRLHNELPAILMWCLKGLDRLAQQGQFTRPTSSSEALQTMLDLASPKAAFIRDHCDRDSNAEYECDLAWADWKEWAEANGHHAGSKQTFGRDLRAVVPALRVGDRQRTMPDGSVRRYRVYVGLKPKPQPTTIS